MKKSFVLLLILFFVLSGCGSSNTVDEKKEEGSSSQQSQENQEADAPGYYIQYIDFPSASTSDDQFDLLFSAAGLKGLDMDIINELLIAPLKENGVPGQIVSETDFDNALIFKDYCEDMITTSAYPVEAILYSREFSPVDSISGKYKSVLILDIYNPDTENPRSLSQLIEDGYYYMDMLPNTVTSSSGIATDSIDTLDMVIKQAGAPDYLYAFAMDPETGSASKDPEEIMNILFTQGPPDKQKDQYVNNGSYLLGYIVGDDTLLIQCKDTCYAGEEPTFEITYYTLVPNKTFEVYQKEYLGTSIQIDLDIFTKALENRHIFTK